MKGKSKHLISILLVIILMLSTNITAMAYDPNADGGGQNGNEGGTWMSTDHQGIRVTIVDKDGNSVASRDMVWEIPSGVEANWKNKVGGMAQQDRVHVPSTNGLNTIPRPVTFDGNSLRGNGAAIREWVINDIGGGQGAGFNIITQAMFGNTYTEQYMIENQYFLMLEAVFFYRFKSGASTGYQVQPWIMYGTVSNFAEWQASSQAWMGSNTGGAMAILSNDVGAKSMHLVEAEKFGTDSVKIPAPQNSTGGTYITDQDIVNTGWGVHVYRPPGNDRYPTYHPTFSTSPGISPDPETMGFDLPNPPEQYNVSKYYVDRLTNAEGITEEIPVGVYTRQNVPKKILIVEEPEYKVEDWFTSPTFTDPGHDGVYEDTKGSIPNVQTGSSPGPVDLQNPGESTLYIKLVKPLEEDEELPTSLSGDVILEQSQISKAIATDGSGSVNGWTTRPVKYIHPTINCTPLHSCIAPGCIYHSGDDDSDGYYTQCGGVTCTPVLSKSNFTHSFTRGEDPVRDIEGWTGVFMPNRLPPDVSGSRPSIDQFNFYTSAYVYESVIHRAGPDKPTLVAYQDRTNNPVNNDAGLQTALGLTKANVSASTRKRDNIDYTRNLKITFADASPDPITKGNHVSVSGHNTPAGEISVTGTAENNPMLKYEATALVKVYAGKQSLVRKGVETLTGQQYLPLKINGNTSKGHGGQMINLGPMRFNTYVRMTWQGTGQYDPDRTEAIVLSEYISEIAGNAYAEAGWWQSDSGVDALNIKSSQWSGAARATTGSEAWKGVNQVLPGGAIYLLDTDGANLRYQIATWQPIIPDTAAPDIAQAMRDAGTTTENFTVAKANERFEDYRESAIQAINNYRVVQWVDKNYNASKAWTGGIKILSPSTDITALYPNAKLNADSKYMLKVAGALGGTSPIEGDLDINSVTSQETYYKVYSDVKGNVYVAKSTSLSGIVTATGSIVANRTATTPTLSSDLMELEAKTKVITNYIKAIERNAGADTSDAFGASLGGKWYNEAFPGIIIQYRSSTFDVGFYKPTIRSAALDPAILPANEGGQSSMYTNAHLFQFRVNERPEGSGFDSKPDRYIGTFEGLNIILPDIENSLQSKKAYAPNATVMDLS